MAKREAHARTASDGAEAPATLTSAAEEHALALRKQLLRSTELAAKQLVGQTRAEGERRIENAGRRAQAIAATVAQIEQAERALADRANAFADASKSLRAELEAFATALADGEERLAPSEPVADEPELRLVASPAPKRTRPAPPPAPVEQFPFAGEVEDAEDELVEGEADEHFGDNEDDEDDDDDEEDEPDELEDDEDELDEEEEEEDEPPTPEEIAQFFREHEEADRARVARRDEAEARESMRSRIRRLFSFPEAEEAHEEEVHEEPPRRRAAVVEPKPPRDPARNRLYTDIAGALIGLTSAAALINYVLID